MITQKSDVIRSLRTCTILWLIYIGVLTLLDWILLSGVLTSVHYYVIHVLYGLVLLAMTYLAFPQRMLGRFFLPFVITLMMSLVVVTHHLIMPTMSTNPIFSNDIMTLRRLPFLSLLLVVTAWQYGRKGVIAFCVGSIALRTTLIFATGNTDELRTITATGVILVMVMITVGYFISYLVTRLNTQQIALEQANIRLAHYASTLEQLSTTHERNRIARELHDTLAHTLSGLTIQLETTKAYLDADPETARTMLVKSLTISRSGLEETRRALKALRAAPLEDLGLLLALRNLAEEAATRGGLELQLSLPTQNLLLTPDIEQCIYRVAQEAISNVIHHANASTLGVTLTFEECHCHLWVCDNGRGFNVQGALPLGHYGVIGMREWVKLVGGDVTIESGPGTKVHLVIGKNANNSSYYM